MDAKLYDTFSVVEEEHWWFVARRAYLSACLSRFMAADGSHKLAEIGAGTGGNFSMLTRFGELDAVETDENALRIAAAKAVENDRVVSLQHGWLPDNIPLKCRYDCVLALDVVEHVEDDQAAIDALVNLLKPSGYLLITVPAYQWLWSAHDEVNHHYRRYTAGGLRSLLNHQGVKILKLGYFNTLLFPIALIRRLWGRWMKNGSSPFTDLQLPGRPVNISLKAIFSLESIWAGRLTMPFGLSVMTVVQRNDE